MLPLFSLLWRMAQLKGEPEHLPARSFLLLLVTSLNIAVSLIISVSIGTQPATTVATTILTNLAAQAVIIFVFLSCWCGVVRLCVLFISSLVCLLLRHLFLGCLCSVLLFFGLYVVFALALVIFFWTLLVFGYILRKAMEIHMAMGVLLAFLLTLVTVALGQLAVGQT